ncbi:MAG: AtpZ/AtpI family protein [Fibrobacterota bacterium]|nr:AtpZ/AtpI family protein [Fibrobacterota bacterium]
MKKSNPPESWPDDPEPDGQGPDGQGPDGQGPGDSPLAPFTPEAAKAAASTQWLSFLHLGWMIVANMVLFVGGGLWLDTKFDTPPVLLLIGVFLAFSGSGYTLYRAVKNLEKNEKENKARGPK